MRYHDFMNNVVIAESKIKKEGGVVVLSLEEYRKLSEQAVPTYYLKENAALKLDQLVKDGLKEYRAGKTISARSIDDARKIYVKRNKRS